MNNSNLREDQKKAIREVLMMVTAASCLDAWAIDVRGE
jgi:hypothetical protein